VDPGETPPSVTVSVMGFPERMSAADSSWSKSNCAHRFVGDEGGVEDGEAAGNVTGSKAHRQTTNPSIPTRYCRHLISGAFIHCILHSWSTLTQPVFLEVRVRD